jgi:UDP-galactose transporter B1
MERLSDLPDTKSELQNGHSTQSKTSANGSAKPKLEASESEEHSPGLIQLAICVGGIYASLYDFLSCRHGGLVSTSNHTNLRS